MVSVVMEIGCRCISHRDERERERVTERTCLPPAVIYCIGVMVLASWYELRGDFRHFRAGRTRESEADVTSMSARAAHCTWRGRPCFAFAQAARLRRLACGQRGCFGPLTETVPNRTPRQPFCLESGDADISQCAVVQSGQSLEVAVGGDNQQRAIQQPSGRSAQSGQRSRGHDDLRIR